MAVGRFWIVMTVDNPGPVERGYDRYKKHGSEAIARNEARRLARQHGGRFATMECIAIVGWAERDFKKNPESDDEIPF